jgi:hypothetical protein
MSRLKVKKSEAKSGCEQREADLTFTWWSVLLSVNPKMNDGV